MPSRTCAQLAAQVDVLSAVLQRLCATLAGPVAREVEASLRDTLASVAGPNTEDADAAQAEVLAPLLSALRR